MNNKKLVIIASLVIALLMIAGAFLLRPKEDSSTTGSQLVMTSPPAARDVSQAELAEADGKEGRRCFVAIDGQVYEIEGSSLWQNGEHLTSEGMAHCGLDLSDAIDKAPHGRSKIEQLKKIGPLVP